MGFSTEHHPGVCAAPDAATQGFVFNHSMVRVKDPAVALDFYSRVMGLRVLRKLDFPEMRFSLYFLAHLPPVNGVPDDAAVAWFDQHQVPFVKRPDQGKMKDVAFIRDPDGYWIEIVEASRLKNLGG